MPHKPKYHRPDVPSNPRPSPGDRGYGHYWRRLRLRKLKADPVCERCRERFAAHVDHRDNDQGNNEWGNLASLCQPCHSRKTVEQDGGLGHGH